MTRLTYMENVLHEALHGKPPKTTGAKTMTLTNADRLRMQREDANARDRLREAAPKMLAALHKVAAELPSACAQLHTHRTDPLSIALKAVRAAIAEAEGKLED